MDKNKLQRTMLKVCSDIETSLRDINDNNKCFCKLHLAEIEKWSTKLQTAQEIYRIISKEFEFNLNND